MSLIVPVSDAIKIIAGEQVCGTVRRECAALLEGARLCCSWGMKEIDLVGGGGGGGSGIDSFLKGRENGAHALAHRMCTRIYPHLLYLAISLLCLFIRRLFIFVFIPARLCVLRCNTFGLVSRLVQIPPPAFAN